MGGMTRRITSPVLVGRTDELHQLEQGLERAGSGAFSTFLVAGEAGIGKSRLVEEFRRRARRSGARVLTGECMDAGEGALDNAALIQVLGQAAAVVPRSVLARMPEARRGELALLVPDLDPHITASRPRSGDQTRLFEAALHLLIGLARDAPVILVIEDLHWSDRSTREFLTFAVRRMQDVGVVLVATYRDDELVPDHPLRPLLGQLERQPEVERLDLARLGAGDVQRMVEIIVDGQPAVELFTEVVAQSDGNPFFVEELLAAGRQAGELPRHLADLLLLRVDATSAGSRLVVRAAAVGGRRVDDQLLEAVVGVDQEVLTESLRGAVAHHILVPSGRGYAFRHALVREAVEAALLPGERQRLHMAWAEAHEREALEHPTTRNAAARAYHWSAADRPTRALPASYEAALEAESVRAYAAAGEHYERTLALWDRAAPSTADVPVERVDVAERGADAARAAGDQERALTLARQALAHLDPRVDAVRGGLLHARIGIQLKAIGLPGASEAFEQALRSVPVDPPSPERASVLGDFTQTLMLAGDDDRAEVVGEEALEVARAVGAAGIEAQVLSVLGTISSSRGDPEGSVARVRESVRIAEEVGDPEHRCRAYLNLAHVRWLAGELADSLAAAEQGLGVALETGLEGSWGGWLRGNAAEAHFLLGDHAAAVAILNEAARLQPTGIAGTLNVIVRARLATLAGRLDEAEQLLGSVAEPAGDDANLLLHYFEVRAELAMWQHRPDVTQHVLERAAEVFDATDSAWLLPPVVAWAAAAVADAAGAGSDDPTGAFAERIASGLDTETVLPPIQRPWVDVAHAELARLRAMSDPELWDRAAEAWDALSVPYRVAYCRFRQAEAVLVTDGSRSQATELLRAAHGTSAALGAQPLREEVEALARRGRIALDRHQPAEGAGVPAPSERLGLTPREWEVLQHVAHGTRNAQIATTLFISEKTVERHVTSILSKLGATNRVEAAGIVHRLAAAGQGPP